MFSHFIKWTTTVQCRLVGGPTSLCAESVWAYCRLNRKHSPKSLLSKAWSSINWSHHCIERGSQLKIDYSTDGFIVPCHYCKKIKRSGIVETLDLLEKFSHWRLNFQRYNPFLVPSCLSQLTSSQPTWGKQPLPHLTILPPCYSPSLNSKDMDLDTVGLKLF